MRRRVSIAAGFGMTHEEIAIGIGCSVPTLAKYFEHELSAGAYARRMEGLEGLHRAAKKGNAAAVKLFLQLNPQAAAPPVPKAPKEAKRGKKEQAQDDAVGAQAGTEWGEILPGSKALQ